MDNGKGHAPIGLTGDDTAITGGSLPSDDDPGVMAAALWLQQDDSAYAAEPAAAIRAARSMLAAADRYRELAKLPQGVQDARAVQQA